jgi:hypothetical protein
VVLALYNPKNYEVLPRYILFSTSRPKLALPLICKRFLSFPSDYVL